MTPPDKLMPETLRGFADLTESKTLARYATAWAADRKCIEALERRRHGLVIEIEFYRHALAGIRDGSSIPKTIAYRALHAGENAALRLFTLARNEAALRSEEER